MRLVLVLSCLASPCAAQPIEYRDFKEIRVALLPGYQQQEGRSLDSTTGTIWKDGGVRIEYDIAGVYTDCKSCEWTKSEVWRKKQVVNGQKAVFVFTKSKMLVVSFPKSHANFYATVHNEGELTDVLLMLATFKGVHTAQ